MLTFWKYLPKSCLELGMAHLWPTVWILVDAGNKNILMPFQAAQGTPANVINQESRSKDSQVC